MSEYPQKPPLTEEELEEFLKDAPIARLGTHNPDGTIHIAPIYFTYQDGEILMGTQEVSKKIRNIKRNNQVSVMVDVREPVLKGALIYGLAELDYDDVVAKRTMIFEKYYSSEDAEDYAKNLSSRFVPVVIHIKPERFVSFDYSK
jgi:general stress protein 26